MRVIELHRNLLGQLVPVRVESLEAAYEIGQRTRDQEILLQEAQSLSHGCGVIRIQHSSKRFRFESFAQLTHKVAGAEFLKIEVIRSSRGPQPESVDRLSPIAHHGTIEGD